MRRLIARVLILTAVIGPAACGSLLAAEKPAAVDWQPYFRDLAGSYEITLKSNPARPLKLRTPPVLRWSQPVRGGDDGAVYLWLDEAGVPQVIGTMFCWPHAEGFRVVVNEFHSLATEPLTASRQGEDVWKPSEGIEWTAFPKAPVPAASDRIRLLQMRQLASRFRGQNLDDNTGQVWRLRLLRQPLYRFDLKALSEAKDTAAAKVLDGAVFALASGTDPEIIVLLAARATDDGHRWEYALARFSDRPLTAWLDDREIWSVERARPDRTKPHTYFDVARLVRPPEIEEGSK